MLLDPDVRRRIDHTLYRTLRWGQNHVQPGLRSLLGVGFMVGGVFGFLPVLGFWMLPLGAAFVAMDIPPMRRRLDVWIDGLEARLERSRGDGVDGADDQDPPASNQ